MILNEQKMNMSILFANLLLVFAFIPLTYEVAVMKMSINIPYSTIVTAGFAFLIFMLISVMKKYWFHVFIYFVGFLCALSLFMNKKVFDENHSKLRKIEMVVEKK
jgi:hypothetical protein